MSPLDPTVPSVITISRQLGSGGAYLGRQLAQRMHRFYADREILRAAAEKLAVVEKDVESREEKLLSFWESFLELTIFASDVYMPPNTMAPTDRELFETEAEIIRHLAGERSAVIVGRCGFHILREHPRHVRIFLHAEPGFRSNRIEKLFQVPADVAARMIAKSDKDRAFYCKTFTGKEWTDARNYDLCIDTGRLGIDASLPLIASAIERLESRL